MIFLKSRYFTYYHNSMVEKKAGAKPLSANILWFVALDPPKKLGGML